MRSNLTTLCYIENDDSYLMLHRTKKQVDVNKDKWIGVGGHFEKNESPDDCLKREVLEETGIILSIYQLRGIITFEFTPDDHSEVSEMTEYMFLYTAKVNNNEYSICDEGDLEWVKKSKINTLNLWEGDKIFFKLLDERTDMFSLKLCYQGSLLTQAVLDGTPMELFEILNEDGTFSGKSSERSIVHSTGLLHATSHVWLVKPNKKCGYDVLLQKRSPMKDSFPDCYDISSAGHIPYGQDYLSSALRELNEEIGIKAEPSDLKLIGTHDCFCKEIFHGKPFLNNEHSNVYMYQCKNDLTFTLQTSEVALVEWMDLLECIQAVDENTIPNCIFLDELIQLKESLDIK